MQSSLSLRAGLVSLALFGLLIGVWHIATAGTGTAVKMDPEYAKLMGATATQGKSAMPGPADVGAKIWQHLQGSLLRQGHQRQGHRHPARLLDRAASASAICWRWRSPFPSAF